ncbi:MAG: class I adenylate-forming enzyme family protein [Syntrophales bacterium]|nr:class I adenylate-forming enzyme family protein [Syntrophales bacterium]
MMIQERMGKNRWYKSTVQELFYEVCEDRPEKTAIVYNGESISYRVLQDRVNRLSQALLNLGVKKGDHICMLPSPTPEFVYLYYATLQIGAVINPLNLMWGQIEFSGVLRRNDPKLIVTIDQYGGRDFIKTLKDCIPDLAPRRNGVSSESIPTLTHLVSFSKTGQKHDGFLDFSQLLESGAGYDKQEIHQRIRDAKPTDIQFICQTSGSTGLSKSALWDHRPPLGTVHFAAKGQDYNENDKYLNITPFYHNSGIYAINLSLTYCGSTLFLMDAFIPAQAVELIDRYEITSTLGFDAHFVAMGKALQAGNYKFTVRKINGAITAQTYDMIINEMMKVDEIDANVQKLYAQTENGPLVTLGEYDCVVYRVNKYSNGRPVPGVELTIKDLGSGERLADGRQGEICYKSPFSFRGYYRQEEETKAIYDAEGFIHSGDFGTLENGYLTFLGRLGGVVKTGGENVSTTYVSALLLELFPAEFEDIQTFGIADPYWGAKIVSIVRMKGGKVLRDIEAIKQDCKGKLANYEIPKAIFVWEGPWPITAEGKVNIKALQQEAEVRADAGKVK